jgi:hypothetical protein
MSSLASVLVGVGVVLVIAAAVGIATAVRHRRWAPMPGGHAHNDYRHHRPLLGALNQGFTSVEVDVWPGTGPGGDRLLVGHDEKDLERWRTLRGLYLEPLARRVEEYGRVQPGVDRPFQLLIEIKSDPERSWELLEAELADYQFMLTRFEAGNIHPGAVTVVISGKPPRDALAKADVRYAACDGTFGAIGNPDQPAALVPLCSENWTWKFSWNGTGQMPAAERELLREWVAKAHAEGRTVRFWGVPGSHSAKIRKAFWEEMRAAEVDYLGTDDLAALRAFLHVR